MKKTLLVVLLIVSNWAYSFACNECGCGMSSMQIGLMPNYYSHFVGIRHQFKSFDTYHSSIFEGKTLQHERFASTELWGRFQLTKNLRVMAFLPYTVVNQEGKLENANHKGLADATILLNATIWKKNTTNFQHEIQGNIGVKLPTGAFQQKDQNGEINPNLQLGTGSTDVLLMASYRMRKGAWILFTEGSQRINSKNKLDYKFGNRTAVNLRLHYWIQWHDLAIIPSIGVTQEFASKDKSEGYVQSATGGYVFRGTLGCDFHYKRLTLAANTQLPIIQRFGYGNIQENYLINTQLLFNF